MPHRVSIFAVVFIAQAVGLALSARAQPTAPHYDPKHIAKDMGTSSMTLDTFLDRLMLAESGGRDNVANPRSTAVGPFQFVVATFLSLARRHFAAETAAMTPEQILLLRTNRAFARQAAAAYTRDNAVQLANAGVAATWPHLRLAFFAGADGAIRIIAAKPETPVSALLGAAAANANPFLARMTARELIERSARDLQQPASSMAGLAVEPGRKSKPNAIPVRCELGLPSCRRWLALAERRQLRQIAAARKSPRAPSGSKAL
ncbi:MAG: hypothetical protein ABL904_27930 [Hyphomicrobiaceae bacterium]